MFNYISIPFPQLKCLPHSFAKLQLCGVISTHLASSINSIMHSKQMVSHTKLHSKYEVSYSKSYNMNRTFYSRSHSKNKASYPRLHYKDKASHTKTHSRCEALCCIKYKDHLISNCIKSHAFFINHHFKKH